ncbi:MAG TPA: hypothetical protein VGK03_12825 [Geothrix sp.]|jgi:hypothetical protein
MRRSFASLLLAIPVAVSVGCAKPDLDFVKIRLGMTKSDVIARLGKPTRTSVVNPFEIFEYEAYDRYGALIVNRRSQFIRFYEGRVESFGNIEDLDPTKPPARKKEADPQASPDKREAPGTLKAAPSSATAFDLRTELEKLEKIKKDGLITDAEFQELRQKVLEKAKAQ